MSANYIFKVLNGGFAWVKVTSENVTCYIPQFGDWYEQSHSLMPGMEWSAVAESCLRQSQVLADGEGVETRLLPGQFHPRIWRGIYDPKRPFEAYDKLDPQRVYGSIFNTSIVAAESLFFEVKELFRYVEPAEKNLASYGHRLRELHILLCTEIEACWSGVMKANERVGDRWKTPDYHWVCEPLRLRDWVVELKDYNLKFMPFSGWSLDQATRSIPWYEAYNKVKHDREANFECGSLRAVLESAAALHILQAAQFGPGIFDMIRGNRFSIFEVVQAPKFALGEIYYAYPVSRGGFDSPMPYSDNP